MKLRLLSDLHAEGGIDKKLFKSQGEDVLVIAGDLNVGADKVWLTLKQFYENQPNIVYVTGNHEYYHNNYQEVNYKLANWSSGTGIKFLNPGVVYYDPRCRKLVDYEPTSYSIPDSLNATDAQLRFEPVKGTVKFIGAPLWTNFRNDETSKFLAQRSINDFRLITFEDRYFTPNDASRLFNNQFGYIKHEYEGCNLKKVIITHFLPATECIDPKYIGVPTSILNDYFANDLSNYIATLENTTWLFGHTHDNVNTKINTTALIANPYGYGLNRNYKECLIDL